MENVKDAEMRLIVMTANFTSNTECKHKPPYKIQDLGTHRVRKCRKCYEEIPIDI